MKVFRNPRQLAAQKKPLVLTIGTFDGLHRGHTKVLEKVKRRAKALGGLSCVMTFKEHPFQVLHPKRHPGLLTSTLHKLLFLERFGIDTCLLMDFTKTFSRQTPEVFVRDFLVKRLKVAEVHLGFKSHFGFHRTGNTETMHCLAKKYGFKFSEIAPFKDSGLPLSSTLIRDLIQRGDLKEASRYLGRPFSVLGTTVRGQKIGRKLGYPTANLDLKSEFVPPRGVYAVSVDILKFHKQITQRGQFLDSKPKAAHLRGVMNIGFRPTTNPKKKVLVPEVHLLDYHKNLYGRILEVTFHSRIRGERKFPSFLALKEQIRLDEKEAKKVLGKCGAQHSY